MSPIKMAPFKTSYLVPAILLNSAFVLHLFNTFISHLMPPPCTASVSPHPFMENLGPLPGTKIAVDVHKNDPLCWGYTFVMVIVQCLAFGSVQDNRVKRRSAKAAKLERLRRQEQEKDMPMKGKPEGPMGKNAPSNLKNSDTVHDGLVDGRNQQTNGHAIGVGLENGLRTDTTPETESDESFTETSEEEMML